jgi:hypothetical protein
MFTFLPQTKGSLIAVNVSGKLTHEDYVEHIIPKIDAVLEKHKKMSLYFELEDFHGWEWQAALDDFKTGVKHRRDIDKVAVVGEKAWHEWVSKIFTLVVTGEIQYFEKPDQAKALKWVQGK